MIKKGALTGLLLFGIFFGAGNLISRLRLEHYLASIFAQLLQDLSCLGLDLLF